MVPVILLAWASAGEVAVARTHLAPGIPVREADLRRVALPDDHPLAADSLNDPVGRIVIEPVLEGEILRAERLLDVDKPERTAVPGLRALRVPGFSERLIQGLRADLWTIQDEGPCTLVQGTWILGIGRDMAGQPDSVFVLVSPEQALDATVRPTLQVRPVSDGTAATPRPEVACSR